MGLRFRKSVKITPGVKLNFNKKSVGLTAGVKGAHYTINSKGKKTASVGIPGTGISYTKSTGGGSKQKKTTATVKHTSNVPAGKQDDYQHLHDDHKKWYQKTGWIIAWLILFFPAGLFLMWKYSDWKKPIKIGVSAVIAFFCLITWLTPPPKLEQIQLTADTRTVHDINSDIEIDIETVPENYSISESNFQISGGTLTASGDKFIFSAPKGSSYKIFAELDDVKSNTLTITVEDKVAIAKAKKEEARKKAEEESKKKAEEEAKKKAEEEAALRLQQAEAQSQQQASSSTNASGNSEVISQPQHPQTPIWDMVWISATGSKYHRIPDCGRMNPNNAWQTSRSEAESMGYEPCKKCY